MALRGHELQKEILLNSLKADKLLNGYIFSGKEGIGKKKFAMDLAAAILCTEGNYFTTCGCGECVFGERHPDLRVIDEKPIKIDMIRELAEYAQMTPFRGKYKVCIVNNVHEMGVEASNAFLKTLEEPGDGTVFILITHRYENILPTIRSRCVKIDFSRLTDEDVEAILVEQEVEAVDEKIIKTASGSVSVAMSLLEKGNQSIQLSVELIKDKVECAKYILSLKEKDDVRDFIMGAYMLILEAYEIRKTPVFLDLSNYLLDISRRLDYNVNLDIFKADLIAKIIGVLSEEI